MTFCENFSITHLNGFIPHNKSGRPIASFQIWFIYKKMWSNEKVKSCYSWQARKQKKRKMMLRWMAVTGLNPWSLTSRVHSSVTLTWLSFSHLSQGWTFLMFPDVSLASVQYSYAFTLRLALLNIISCLC